MIDRELSAAWRERRGKVIGADLAPPAEAEKIAGELPPAAQTAIMFGPPWALDLDPVVAIQLEFFELLEDSLTSLNDMGWWVFRVVAGWDADYGRREREYDAWFAKHYEAAYYVDAPGHKAARTALFLDPSAQDPLLDVVAERRQGVIIGNADDIRTARFLANKQLVKCEPVRDRRGRRGLRVLPTDLGVEVAMLFKIARRANRQIFEGARQSAWAEEHDALGARAMEGMTAILAHQIAGAERAAEERA